MAEEGSAIKIIKNKELSPRQEENKTGY